MTDPDGEEIGACWGYYGDSGADYAAMCAREDVDAEIVHRMALAAEAKALADADETEIEDLRMIEA